MKTWVGIIDRSFMLAQYPRKLFNILAILFIRQDIEKLDKKIAEGDNHYYVINWEYHENNENIT